MFKKFIISVCLVIISVSLAIPQAMAKEPITELPAGIDPNNPISLSLAPKQTVLERGHLEAGEERWFAVEVAEVGGEARYPLKLTTFVTPGDGNMVHNLHLDIYPGNYAHYWSVRNTDGMNNFGAGDIVERDGDPLTAELIWYGHVNNDEVYLVCLRNDNDFAVDYWLFTDDIVNAELGDPAPAITPESVVADIAPEPVVELGPGHDPNSPISLTLAPKQTVLERGHLEAGEERWFAVEVAEVGGSARYPLKLTTFVTPGDGNMVHNLHLDIYPGNYAHYWSVRNADGMNNFGAGDIVERDGDHLTAELLWFGHVNNDEVYLVCLRNDNHFAVDYWLFTDDIVNAELGEQIP